MTPFATYPIIEVPHYTDGDTLWVRREWHVGWVGTVEMIARDDRAGVCVRLTDGDRGLNTPEKGKEGYEIARRDLQALVDNWHAGSGGALVLSIYAEKPDSFGRLLGDVTLTTGSGSQFSVVAGMREKGWAARKK